VLIVDFDKHIGNARVWRDTFGEQLPDRPSSLMFTDGNEPALTQTLPHHRPSDSYVSLHRDGREINNLRPATTKALRRSGPRATLSPARSCRTQEMWTVGFDRENERVARETAPIIARAKGKGRSSRFESQALVSLRLHGR
jgi:hypothetical protein